MKKETYNGEAASRIIISQRSNLRANLIAGPVVCGLTDRAIRAYVDTYERLGIPTRIDLTGKLMRIIDPGILRQLWQEFALSTVSLGNFGSDDYNFWLRRMNRYSLQLLYEHTHGRNGDFELTEEAFLASINIDVTDMCEAVYLLASEVSQRAHDNGPELRANEYLNFITLLNGAASLPDNFEDLVRDSMTVYASPKAAGYFARLQPILKNLNELETEFGCPGLVATALHSNGDGYTFDNQKLINIH